MPRRNEDGSAWSRRVRRMETIAASARQSSAGGGPTTILHGGTIRTMDPAVPVAEALAIRDGRIAAVGTAADVLALADASTEVVDLDGRVAVPGLNDSHMHLSLAALDVKNVALDGARSVADVLELIGERVRVTPPGQWIEARTLWHESMLREGRFPTRWELDRVSPDHPVYIPRGGHVAVVNSLGLRLAGISRTTLDPEGGTIVRDADGEPTGVLLERARDRVTAVLPPEEDTDDAELLAAQMADLNAMGITSVTDPGVLPHQFDAYLDLHEAGRITVRSHLLLRVHDSAGVALATRTLSPRIGDDLLRFDGFKYSLDGGVEGAYFYEPYELVEGEQTDPGYRGELILPTGGHDELRQMFMHAARAGFQFQTHAVGDAAIDELVEHYAAVNEQIPLAPLRWVAVHFTNPTARAISRVAELGIMTTMQDNAVLLGRNRVRWWGESRARAANPMRTVIDAGIVVGGGTDGPVVPLSPTLSLWWMRTRGMLQGGELGPEHAVSGEDALRSYTVESARTQYVDDQRGQLSPGMVADIAVFDRDPVTARADDVKDLRCSMTILGGDVVYSRA